MKIKINNSRSRTVASKRMSVSKRNFIHAYFKSTVLVRHPHLSKKAEKGIEYELQSSTKRMIGRSMYTTTRYKAVFSDGDTIEFLYPKQNAIQQAAKALRFISKLHACPTIDDDPPEQLSDDIVTAPDIKGILKTSIGKTRRYAISKKIKVKL